MQALLPLVLENRFGLDISSSKDGGTFVQGVSQTTNVWATHPQDLHLVRVQPQPIFWHPLQYSLETALKGQNDIHCGWRKGDVALTVISILMA